MTGAGLLTFGETLALLAAPGPGALRGHRTLDLSFGGAESNVAIGAARLGVPARWIGRVGDDEFGHMILEGIAAEEVDVSGAITDGEAPTALMVRERVTGLGRRVTYYRRGLAGSRLAPGDVPESAVAAAALLHVTGITPAISASARDAVFGAVEAARAAGVPVSLDVNHRPALWDDAAARGCLADLAGRVDILFAGEDEAELLVGAGTAQELARAIHRLGAERVVVKRGDQGAVAVDEGERGIAAVAVDCVDTVGAGDAFVAGYLAELLAGAAPAVRLATAAFCGARACTVADDWSGGPRRDELPVA